MLPHTADLIVEAWGPDLAACVEEALTALIGLCIASRRARIGGTHRARIGPDAAEAVLLGALDEALFVLDTSIDAPVTARVRAVPVDDDRPALEVELALATPDTVESTGAGPKAISRSELTVESGPVGVRCTFLVDV